MPRPENEQSAVELLQLYGIVPTEKCCPNGHHMRLEYEDHKRKQGDDTPTAQSRWRCCARKDGQQCTATFGVRNGIPEGSHQICIHRLISVG